MLKMLRKPKRRPILIGPEDHGKPMALDDFDKAISREGYLYELNKGVIEVVDVPHPRHLAQVTEIRNQLILYQYARPGIIHTVAEGTGSKLLIGPSQSERHPDLSVYLSAPPDTKDVWSLWRPAIVIEVVSPSSIKRDYEEKPSEYLEFGVDEYWIVDAAKQRVTVMIRWRGQWQEKIVKTSQKLSTSQLPGFSPDLKKVMAAGK